ncbi:MAG: DUF2975 domain-containing protein [Ruminococcus sp.]|nr:DUF2975 domain-containing protein [Ruminococcus sp.]MDD6097215.1 DUF2975 domain-containing protein [Oscillospiraceae bacterium]
MWTKTKSLFLSRLLTAAMTGLVLIMSFFVPAISKWYESFSDGSGLIHGSIVIPMCITLYICEVFALAALYSLHILLKNIYRDEVFVPANTACLRKISWSCIFAGCTLFIFGLWKTIFFLAAFMAVMFGLIMRVLKNVFEKAVEIKSENDFTI